tara:strand:+ start:2047 stop:2664 length:618 start_codon:yes stop_codon:yes gene_type:complete
MTYLVSILIPTLIERRKVFNELIDKIYKQIEEDDYKDKIEIVSICDDRSVKLSDKRNSLQKLSRGKYFLHLDDDDELSDDFCKSVVDHIEYLPTYQKNEPDCIGYDQLSKVQGKRFIVKPNIKCGLHLTPTNGTTNYPEFYRYPWQWCMWHEKYKTVYRTDSDTNAREDQNWLKKIQLEYPKNMSYIEKCLHIYNFDNPELSTCQ